MNNINDQILDYFDSFTNSSDYDLLLKIYDQPHNFDDTDVNDKEYCNLVRFYNKLLSTKESYNYRIEVDRHCTALIEKLFQRYVGKNTFVLTTEQEHPAVKNYLPENNTFIICVNELKYENAVSQIIKKFKESNCTEFFLIMAGVIPGSAEILDETFFRKLKYALTKENIPHIFVLDDCQGLFMIQRDYSDFDAILGTAHVLVRYGFSMGILFTKLPHKIGYINKAGLKDLSTKLNYVFNHKQDALKFNGLITQFVKDEIDDNVLKIKDNQAQHMFVVSTDGVKFSQKKADEMKDYGIIFSELNTQNRFIRLRYQDCILFNSQDMLNVLQSFKKMLHSLKRMKDLATDLNFDKNVDINYDFIVNGTNKGIGEVNKKIYRSSFNVDEISEILNNSSLSFDKAKTNIVYHYIFEHQR